MLCLPVTDIGGAATSTDRRQLSAGQRHTVWSHQMGGGHLAGIIQAIVEHTRQTPPDPDCAQGTIHKEIAEQNTDYTALFPIFRSVAQAAQTTLAVNSGKMTGAASVATPLQTPTSRACSRRTLRKRIATLHRNIT